MRRSILSSGLACLLIAGGPAAAVAADGMTFKNNLLPGHFTVHRIVRTVHRTVPRKDYVEKLTSVQVAEWVQCNLGESRPGSVTVYQMMADGPARVTSLFKGAEKVNTLPPARAFNLSKRSARLYSATKEPRDAPYQVPLCDPAEQAVLRAMLDVAHWPRKKIKPNHAWERDIDDGGFKGTQRFEFLGLDRVKDNVIGVVTLYVEGRFAGLLEKNRTFVKGQAVIHWARLDRTLLKLKGRAEYSRKRPDGVEESYVMEIDVGLRALKMLSESQRDRMLDQLNAFAEADKLRREKKYADARALCSVFEKKWPRSPWLPVVEELAERARPRNRDTHRLTTSQIKKLLGKSLVAWEAARTNRMYDLMDTTREALAALTRDYGDKLRKIARKGKSKIRAQAVFALAFSDDPGDFNLVQKAARDNSARVRAMALAGLAARGSPKTSVEMLLLVLDDKKASVRSRACRAVASCVSREHYSISKVVEKLKRLMVHDKSSAVRRSAIRALAAAGAPADIPALEDALNHELDRSNRKEIEAAIERLRALDR
ncbi:MAG: HEAT repeat domain-containing protein [Phycisphaerae bacterium]